MSTTLRSREHRRDFNSKSFCLLGLLIVMNYAMAIDYGAYRKDPLPRGTNRQTVLTTRKILEELNHRNVTANPTLQDATEHLLQYGALLRMQILDVFGKLVYDHYDDFGMSQIESLYRIYSETLERKYNIFDIVPSILEDPDTRPTKICAHINQHVRTFLKESSNICMSMKIHDEPHVDTLGKLALNATREIDRFGEIRKNYPNGFSLKAVLYHLRAGRLRLTPAIIAGLLYNVQYDNFNDQVHVAERQLVTYLRSSGARITKKLDKSLVSAPTVGELLRRYLSNGDNLLFRDKRVANQAAYLSKHVVREVEAVSENIELLGTVYDNGTINFKYLFQLILPNDTVDLDILEARDYVVRNIPGRRNLETLLSVEKYQQTGPDQLLLEILRQLRDIGYAEDLVTSLYAHARFWHKSHMIENLNELLELFDAYENLRNVPNYRELVKTIDTIKNNLRDSKNVTIELLCSRPRECLRIGLEIVGNCETINDNTKRAIESFNNRTICGCSSLLEDSLYEISEKAQDNEDTMEILNSITNRPDQLTDNEDDFFETISEIPNLNVDHSGETSTLDGLELKVGPSDETAPEICVGDQCNENTEVTGQGPGTWKEACSGPDCEKYPVDNLRDCEGPDCGENLTRSFCEGPDCPEISCEDGICSHNPEIEDCPDCLSSSCEGDECQNSNVTDSTQKNECEGINCPMKNCSGEECEGQSTNICEGPNCAILNNCSSPDCSIDDERKCKGDDCSVESLNDDCEDGDCSGSTSSASEETTKCTGDNCSDNETFHECEGPDCSDSSFFNSTILTKCDGFDCSTIAHQGNCQGSNCSQSSKFDNDCEGSGCSESIGDKDCEGSECQSKENIMKEDCEGEDCFKEVGENTCEGPDCLVDGEQVEIKCKGDDCPNVEADKICEGPDCPVDEKLNDETCVGENCPEEKTCDGPDCLGEPFVVTSAPCQGENCSDVDDICTDESCTTKPVSTIHEETEESPNSSASTAVVNETTTPITVCDNSDPNYHRKLERLRKMRLTDALSSKPRSSYEIFDTYFATSENTTTKISDETSSRTKNSEGANMEKKTYDEVNLNTNINEEASSETKNDEKASLKRRIFEEASLKTTRRTVPRIENSKKSGSKVKNRSETPLLQGLTNVGNFSRRHDASNSHVNKRRLRTWSNGRKSGKKGKNAQNDLRIGKIGDLSMEKNSNLISKKSRKTSKKVKNRIVTRIFTDDDADDHDEATDQHSSLEKINSHGRVVKAGKIKTSVIRASNAQTTNRRNNGEQTVVKPMALRSINRRSIKSVSELIGSNKEIRTFQGNPHLNGTRESNINDKNRKRIIVASTRRRSARRPHLRMSEDSAKLSVKSKIHDIRKPSINVTNRKLIIHSSTRQTTKKPHPRMDKHLSESSGNRRIHDTKKTIINDKNRKSILNSAPIRHPRKQLRMSKNSPESSGKPRTYDTRKSNIDYKNRKSIIIAPSLSQSKRRRPHSRKSKSSSNPKIYDTRKPNADDKRRKSIDAPNSTADRAAI